MKKIIAYSSIAHMAMTILGIFTLTVSGLSGAIYLMFAHGLTSAALFICIGILYERFRTRAIEHYSGIRNIMPNFSFYFFWFLLANIAFPGTCNFVGEISLFHSFYTFNISLSFIIFLTILVTTAYSILLYVGVCLGKISDNLKYGHNNELDLTSNEHRILFILSVLVFFFGMFGSILFNEICPLLGQLVSFQYAIIG